MSYPADRTEYQTTVPRTEDKAKETADLLNAASIPSVRYEARPSDAWEGAWAVWRIEGAVEEAAT